MKRAVLCGEEQLHDRAAVPLEQALPQIAVREPLQLDFQIRRKPSRAECLAKLLQLLGLDQVQMTLLYGRRTQPSRRMHVP